MAKLFYILVVFIVTTIGLTFTYMNYQVVEINYFYFSREINLSVLLLITLIFGVVIGYLVHFLSAMKIRRELSNTKKELKNMASVSL